MVQYQIDFVLESFLIRFGSKLQALHKLNLEVRVCLRLLLVVLLEIDGQAFVDICLVSLQLLHRLNRRCQNLRGVDGVPRNFVHRLEYILSEAESGLERSSTSSTHLPANVSSIRSLHTHLLKLSDWISDSPYRDFVVHYYLIEQVGVHREWVSQVGERRPLFKGCLQFLGQINWCVDTQDFAPFPIPACEDPHLKPCVSFLDIFFAYYVLCFFFVWFFPDFANHLD
jgi:hypothetical protein